MLRLRTSALRMLAAILQPNERVAMRRTSQPVRSPLFDLNSSLARYNGALLAV